MIRRLSLLLTIFGLICNPVFAADNQPVKIGAILPLTGDGSFWGINPKNGIEFALKDLAREGKPGFKVIYEDDKCDPKEAVAAYRKLTSLDGVKIILGPACSSASLAVMPLAEKDGILLLTFSEADSISQGGENIFRLYVPNGRQGRKLAQYVRGKAGVSSIAVISIQNAFGTDIAGAFQEEFEKSGGKIVAREEYDPAARDFRSQLLRLKAARPEALFFASYIADGAILMRQAKEMGAAASYFTGSTINSPDFFQQLGPLAENLVFADIKDQTSEEFRSRFAAEYSVTWPGMQSGAPLFYDIVRILSLVGATNDIPRLRESLYTLRGYTGVSGPFSFDRSGDLERTHSMFTVKDGKVVAAE